MTEPTTTTFAATRITLDSDHDFPTTRARFDEQVPFFDQAIALELAASGANWSQVETRIGKLIGPSGFVALSRLDQGALMSLHGEPLNATQYLVGNPLIAQQIIDHNPAAALHAPFPLAIYHDHQGVHIAYTQPSASFASLGSADIDVIAKELDTRILATVEQVCRST
jgi:uncharacterized protein (DUF302 family)